MVTVNGSGRRPFSLGIVDSSPEEKGGGGEGGGGEQREKN